MAINMKFKRILSLIISAIMILSACVFSYGAESTDEPRAFTNDDFLRTRGQSIVNAKGEKVILHGVNLGAWLIWEDWLCPYQDADDHYSALSLLEERFGREKAYELMNIYIKNWITETDLDNIREMGFNCVRVPFWFRNFYYDDEGTKILDNDGNWNFSILDWIVEECAERGIYVILDMHGAVGYQSDSPHSGKGKSVGLYDDNEQGKRFRKLTDELWTAIAERFKDSPAIAMFDLLNEPSCDCTYSALRRRINNEKEYDRLYKTVRKVDSRHIISLECVWGPFALPNATLKGWKNVCYQIHLYNDSDFSFGLIALFTKLLHPDVPILMGEFYPHKETTWNGCFKTMKNLGYSWCLWTYKATGHGMWSSDWCIFGSKDGFYRAKLATDSFDDIAWKWGEMIRTENGFQDSGHYEANVKNWVK